MSFVIAAPEALDSAATDLVVLGSTLGAATAAAAAQTTGIVAAAHDEVSAAIAALFSAHGQAYQAASAQAAAFHTRFIRARSRHPQQETPVAVCDRQITRQHAGSSGKANIDHLPRAFPCTSPPHSKLRMLSGPLPPGMATPVVMAPPRV